MSYSDLIHKYFDEGLDGTSEDVLFERMANDADLRKEFAEHMKIHSFVKQDVMHITTPAVVTHGIFEQLGLHIPAVENAVGITATWFQRVGTAIAAYVPYAITALMTTSFLIIAYILFFQPDDQRITTLPEIMQSVPVTQAPQVQTPSPQRAVEERASIKAKTVRSLSSSFIPAFPAIDREGAFEAETEPSIHASDIAEHHPAEITTTESGEAFRTKHIADLRENPPESPHFFFSRSSSFLSNFVVEMRMLNSTSQPNVDLPPNASEMFKDVAFSIVYKLSDYHALGVEYGREAFGQEFASINPPQDETTDYNIKRVAPQVQPWIPGIYRRNVMLDWVGLVWKASFPDLGFLNFVYPYGRTVLGGTQEGLLGKMRIGFEIFPTHFSMLNVGVEGTLLKYQIEDVWYQTNKLGWTAGVAIGF